MFPSPWAIGLNLDPDHFRSGLSVLVPVALVRFLGSTRFACWGVYPGMCVPERYSLELRGMRWRWCSSIKRGEFPDLFHGDLDAGDGDEMGEARDEMRI